VKSVRLCPLSTKAFIQAKERRKEHLNGSISGKRKERKVRLLFCMVLGKTTSAFLPKKKNRKVFQGL